MGFMGYFLVFCIISGMGYYIYILLGKLNKINKENFNIKKRFSNVLNLDEEFDRVNSELNSFSEKLITKKREAGDLHNEFLRVNQELSLFRDDLDMMEMGFYKPHFDYTTSERFKERIMEIKQRQKDLVKSKDAFLSDNDWMVNGSKSEGKKMNDKAVRLTARAFNNECDVIIANTRWNNAVNMEKRIKKAFSDINKLNESNRVNISGEYLELKLLELQLTFEYKEKIQEEKLEQAEIKAQMREEVKFEKELALAEKQEIDKQRMFDKAVKEAEKLTGHKLLKMQEKLELMKNELAEAHEKSVRAKSMAEQTRTGHVYIISNLGSFGKDVYKIGMTRRLEPMDRVKELGDASVPFTFDVHAMVSTDDAPTMEKHLHKVFDAQRLNKVNKRKEFFNVSLIDIESEVQKINPDAEFIHVIEAKEYRESKVL